MSGSKFRPIGLGMVATAGAGVVGLSALTHPAVARSDDIGLVLGGSGIIYYRATTDNPYGEGLYTPEGRWRGRHASKRCAS
jgi:hypothetical protein